MLLKQMSAKINVYLYDEPRVKALDIALLQAYIQKNLPSFAVNVRPDIFTFAQDGLTEKEQGKALENIARKFAESKVKDISNPDNNFAPLKGEIDFEYRRLQNPTKSVFGILYDGFKFTKILQDLIREPERSLRHVHIVFTNQLVGTWDEDTQRYHIRTSVYSFPSVISTGGIVEGPAKPREYYLIKQQAKILGMTELASAEFQKSHKDEFVDYEDKRLTDVLKGYVMQAIAYQITGEAFCSDPDCRLYNAHWQSELIRAQLNGEYEYCPFHEKLIRDSRRTL
jgi:hypothetical protein